MRLNEIGSCAEKSQVESAAAAAGPQGESFKTEREGRVDARRLRCLERRREVDDVDRTEDALEDACERAAGDEDEEAQRAPPDVGL